MGAWGVHALESDEGLDVLDSLRTLARGRSSLLLDELLDHLVLVEMLGTDPREDEYLWDVAAIAAGELLVESLDAGAVTRDELGPVTIVPTATGLRTLVAYVQTLRSAEPQEREIVELREGDPAWQEHVGTLLARLASVEPEEAPSR